MKMVLQYRICTANQLVCLLLLQKKNHQNNVNQGRRMGGKLREDLVNHHTSWFWSAMMSTNKSNRITTVGRQAKAFLILTDVCQQSLSSTFTGNTYRPDGQTENVKDPNSESEQKSTCLLKLSTQIQTN